MLARPGSARPIESQVRRPMISGHPMVSALTRFRSAGRCHSNPAPSPITRFRAIATTATISSLAVMSDGDRCRDVRRRLIAGDLEILEGEAVNAVRNAPQHQCRQGTRGTGQLQPGLLEMI